MRGFVLSLVSLLFLVFLYMLSTTLHDNHLRMERALTDSEPVLYGSSSVQSAAIALNSILGPRLVFSRSPSMLNITALDTVPLQNASERLDALEGMLEGPVANQSHADIRVDFSNLSGGQYGMRLCGRYIYSNGESGRMLFRGADGGTDAEAYYINITVLRERAGYGGFSPAPGGMAYVLRYSDLNGTIEESGTLDPSAANTFLVNYTGGGSLELGLGRAGGSDGSLWLSTTNASAQVRWTAVLPPMNSSERMNFEYGAPMEYAAGAARVERNIGT